MTAWLAALASVLTVIASGALDGIGWAFYRRHMRAAERKRELRKLARAHLETAILHHQVQQAAMTAQLHQHAHTMAGMTGQAYQVSQSSGMWQVITDRPVYVPELIVPLSWVSDDPRHQIWKYPLS